MLHFVNDDKIFEFHECNEYEDLNAEESTPAPLDW